MLEHAAEKVRSATHNCSRPAQARPCSAHETDPVFRNYTSEVASASQARNPSDLFLQMGDQKIVEAKISCSASFPSVTNER